jgi:hypothetical protein
MERTVLLKETEQEPSARPIPLGLSEAALRLDSDLGYQGGGRIVWRRIEAWTTHRWGQRPVTWVALGPGEFMPRLKPAVLDTAERWDGSTWVQAALDPTPLGGLWLPDAAHYKITAAVGHPVPEGNQFDNLPQDVAEAFRRLAEYLAQTKGDGELGAHEVSDGDYAVRRPANWAARALQYSGAADLLRPYRD